MGDIKFAKGNNMSSRPGRMCQNPTGGGQWKGSVMRKGKAVETFVQQQNNPWRSVECGVVVNSS